MGVKQKVQKKLSDAERIEFAKQVEMMYETATKVSLKHIAWVAFVRGIATGLGIFLGGTLLVALVLWILSLLGGLPFLEDLTRAAEHSIEQGKQ